MGELLFPPMALDASARRAARRASRAELEGVRSDVEAIRLAALEDDMPLRAVARRLGRSHKGDALAFVDGPNEGAVGHTRGGTGSRWTDIARHELISALAQYDPRTRGPWANRIDDSRTWDFRKEVPQRTRDELWAANGLGSQLRCTIYDGETFIGLIALLYPHAPPGPAISRLTMVLPTVAETLWGARLLSHASHHGLPLDRLLDLEDEPVLLVDGRGTVIHCAPGAGTSIRRHRGLREALLARPGTAQGARALRTVARVAAVPMLGRTLYLVRPRLTDVVPTPRAPSPKLAVLPTSLARVAQALAEGRSDKEIASAMSLTVPTVRTYVQRIYRTLGVHKRAELALLIAEES